MKTFIGTKVINATPMNRADYNAFRGWLLPVNENGADEGYLVEYTDGGKPNHPDFEGYVSWSPQEQFEAAYLPIGDVSGMAAHEQRVVAEKAELDAKRTKLTAFYSTARFHELPESEQSRLLKQGVAMRTYSEILGSRIACFAVEPKMVLVSDGNTEVGTVALRQVERTDDQTIESEIQAKNLTAPRVTPADIEANIASEHYFTAKQGCIGALGDAYELLGKTLDNPLGLLTFCVLILRNGFTVTGESACASPENFDAEIGRKIARENAKQKIWPLMGYQLREQLYQATQPAQSPE